MVLETERILLRDFIESDLDALAAMMSDPEQMSLYPRPRTKDESNEWLQRNLRLYEERGFGFWLMEGLENNDFLGYCGIRPVPIEGAEEIEMGWHTKKQLWSQGLATEAAAACRDLAFTRFDIPRLVATIDLYNPPSERVAQKIGMQMEKKAVLDRWPCLIYSIERDPS